LHIMKIQMMRAKKKKLNRILILVYMAISMVMSTMVMKILNNLLMPIIEKN